MEWLIGKLTQIQQVLGLVFTIVLAAIAIKLVKENKIIAILLFVIAAGILGWFVFDARSAIQTMTNIVK